ncbi:hypothetical protein D9M71_64230 [compost metagenome]
MEKDLNGFGQGQHRPMGLAGTGGLENAKTGLEGPFFFCERFALDRGQDRSHKDQLSQVLWERPRPR